MAKFEFKKTNELKENPHNVRKHPKKQIEQLKKSISEFGFTVPIVINRTGVILAGHGRYIAACELGMDKVACIVADGLSEKQERAYALVDNRVGQNSEWDRDLLIKELELLSTSFDFAALGFSDFELPNKDAGPKLSDFISPPSRSEKEQTEKQSGPAMATIKIIVTKADEVRAIGLVQRALSELEFEIR